MKKIKFVIFGVLERKSNTRDLYDEILSRGHECAVLDFSDTIMEFSNRGFRVRSGNMDIMQSDIFLFRKFAGFVPEVKIMMERLLAMGKVVVDEGVAHRITEGKIFQSSKLQRAGIDIPRTVQAYDLRTWKAVLVCMQFPIVIKPVKGRRGEGVMKLDSRKAALEFFRSRPYGYLAQEYFPLDGDYRLFVVQGKVLGAIKRFVIDGDFRTNCSLGSRTEEVKVTREMRTIATRAAKAVGYEVAGVDLIAHDGKFYVLEVNASPQWQGFKETTGINPAGAIIDLALEKYKRRKLLAR
jgi:ribosomal protein S6--L-glutamate ligase